MKIGNIFSALLIMLLPFFVFAGESKDLEKFCDNIIFNEAYKLYHGSEYNSRAFTYALGDQDKRGKYKYDLLELCENADCGKAQFGKIRIFDRRSLELNMPSFLLYFNNIEIFELLLLNRPEMKNLMDDGMYPDITWCNGEFITPALNAVKEGQLGILKYLVNNYNANLFKKAGYIYHNKSKPQEPLDAKTIAANAVEKWANNPDRLKCAIAVQDYVNQWYTENENNQVLNSEAAEYNNRVFQFASDPIYIMENITPIEFQMLEFTPSLDIFKPQKIEDNLTQNIEKQIDALIERIMHDFDLSAFGNQA